MTEHEEALAQSALLLTTIKYRGKICVQMKLGLEDSWRWVTTGSSFELPAPTDTSSRGFKYLVSLPLGQMRRKGLCLFTDTQSSVHMVYLLRDEEVSVLRVFFPTHRGSQTFLDPNSRRKQSSCLAVQT